MSYGPIKGLNERRSWRLVGQWAWTVQRRDRPGKALAICGRGVSRTAMPLSRVTVWILPNAGKTAVTDGRSIESADGPFRTAGDAMGVLWPSVL
jgi:hypothetical protein